MAVCRSCGADLAAAARYCSRCGVRVATLAADERKIVTILFADIAASTAMGAERDPEDARALIRPQLALMRDELSRHGGTIEKYIGDAVMAVFGAPVAHEDDPERAVRAALAIRDALGAGVRVAVNTGEAVVALAAEPEAGEGFVAGDVVNTAFRIEEATPDGAVCVGEATYRATAGTIEFGEPRLVEAKGKPEPLGIWEAISASAEPRADYGPPRAPLVGRREELSLILDTLARARRDKTVQLATLVGVPGIGKSRLVWELQRALEDEPQLVTWRRGRCLPYGDGVTYWALGEIVKAQAGVLETDDVPTAEAKLAQAVRDLLPDLAEATWVETQLRPLLALEASTAERREEAFAAWRRLFEALADLGPLVLVFEDLHWADEGLLDFIEHVADWSRDAPLLLLCTARPELLERRRDWGARGNALTIALPPLTEHETSRLVSLLLRQSLPDELRDTVLARAEGNPLYAEEFVRMLVDRGLLVHEGDWRLRTEEVPLPESVQGIIASRLDALSANEKALLQAAAVVGRTFWPGAVEAVSGADREELDDALLGLDRRELLRRHRTSALASEPQYAFRHVLVRDVAYSQIPRASRAEKHLAAAAWIEALGRPEDHSETLAHHYLAALEYAHAFGEDAGEFAGRARIALRDAGERALGLNAFATAARYFEGALELWPPSEDGRARVVFGSAKAGYLAGDVDDEPLAAAADELQALDEVELAAEIESARGLVAAWRGDGQSSLDHRRRAVELLADRATSPSKAFVLSNLAGQFMLRDDAGPAIEYGRAALEIAAELGLAELRARALRTIGVARTTHGDLEGLRDLEKSVEVALGVSSPEVVVSYVNLAGAQIYLGELGESFALYERAREAARRFGDTRVSRWLDAERVAELYWRGDWESCVAHADAFLEDESGGAHYMDVPVRIASGHVRLARGEFDRAEDDAARAVDVAEGSGDLQLLYPALAFQARVSWESGAPDVAARAVDLLLDRLRPEDSLAGWLAWCDAAVVLEGLGRGSEFAAWADLVLTRTRWLDAAAEYAGGRFTDAAASYDRIGSLPDAAHARMRAGGADAERAHSFYERVGARVYRGLAGTFGS